MYLISRKPRNQSERVTFKTLRFNVETFELNHLHNTFPCNQPQAYITFLVYFVFSFGAQHAIPSIQVDSYSISSILRILHMPKQLSNHTLLVGTFLVEYIGVSFQIYVRHWMIWKAKTPALIQFRWVKKKNVVEQKFVQLVHATMCFSYSLNVVGDMRWSEFQVSWLLHS